MFVTVRSVVLTALIVAPLTSASVYAQTGADNLKSTEIRRIHCGDYWVYDGEVRQSPRTTRCSRISAPFCADGYCANGQGDLGTDGSWSYVGAFADGYFHGHGSLENDYYEYIGGFSRGKFHGRGVLTCLQGNRFEGDFGEGSMSGQFKITTPSRTVQHVDYSGVEVGWGGPCKN
jgi:hypothetical protein